MTYIFFAIVLLLCVINAFVDSLLIKRNIVINHIVDSAIFTIFCVFFAIITREITIAWIVYTVITTLLVRAGWFSFLLNIFRGKSIWYVSPNAELVYTGEYTSWWDDVLSYFKNPNEIRFGGFIFSLIWLFIHHFIPFFN